MDLLDKGLPVALDAERFVLASILLDGNIYISIAGQLEPADFALESNRRIWAAMRELYDASTPIDRVTLAHQLHENGQLESVGGLTYIVGLDDGIPKVSNVDHYVNLIRDKSTLRKMIYASQNIMNRCLLANEKPEEIMADAGETFLGLRERGQSSSSGLRTAAQIMDAFPGGINAFLDPTKRQKGLQTGFTKFDEMTGGLHSKELVILAARPSAGKAQPIDRMVKTKDGWKRIGDLRVGDEVASIDGAPSTVSGVYPQGKRNIFRVRFVDGRSTECCAEHLWRIRMRTSGPMRKGKVPPNDDDRTRSTRWLLDHIDSVRQRIYVPLVSGDFGSDRDILIDPWLLGVLLGDGDFANSVRITTPDIQVVDRIREIAVGMKVVNYSKTNTRCPTYNIAVKRGQPNPLVIAVAALGLRGKRSYEKFIPQQYLSASKETRWELLRGLMDSDGTVDKKGSLFYSTSSEALANDIQVLARSLGGTCRIKLKKPFYTYKGERRVGRPSYVLSIRFNDPKRAMSLQRKRVKIQRTRAARLRLLDIEPVGDKECVCIRVTHPSSLYITDDYIVTHNTALALNIAQHVAIKLGHGVLIFSLEMSSSALLSRMICAQSRIDAQRWRHGYVNEHERRRLLAAAMQVQDAPIYIDEASAIGLLELHSKVREMQREHPVHLVIVDYLQLMALKGKSESRQQEVSMLSRGLKALSKDLDVPMLVLSQLSRAPDTRTGDHRPQLSDLRESGSIEADADVVAFVFREEMYKRDREDLRGVAELIIGKQRNGPIGKIDLVFIGNITRFENRAEDLEGELPLTS